VAYMYDFLVLKGPNPGDTIELSGEEITIGRDKSNTVHIDDQALSRSHARLVRTSSGYTLQDLGSTNGTYLNGKPVSALCPLKDGDQLSIGETLLLEFHEKIIPGEDINTLTKSEPGIIGDKTTVLHKNDVPISDQTEKNVALVKRFFQEVWKNGNLNVVDELVSQNYEDHGQPPGTPPGHGVLKANVDMFRSAFSDFQLTPVQILAENDRVAIRLSGGGTNNGNFMGMAPTGKQVSLGGMTFMRIQDEKIAESWGIFDIPGLMQQLGAGTE
jgi:pSer/pThr/pTyr-binding forkhead associated (FHA) protein